MRKMKKINGYLVVKFNDREKRLNADTGLGSFGVIDAEQYTGILDIDRDAMEYDSADTIEEAIGLAMRWARIIPLRLMSRSTQMRCRSANRCWRTLRLAG